MIQKYHPGALRRYAGVISERNKNEYDQPTHPEVIIHITKLLTALEDQ